ncbi:hypothetical protein P3T20_005766 [Paraburkholderia sp. GAS206C]|uniref:hypothetical protein n=1 Tax=unclassified Paraburkholderia TaxID=2615204 RepID=UPI003D1D54E9
MQIAEEVARVIIDRMTETGNANAVRIEAADIKRITGCLPAILIEEIRKELAVASLAFVELANGGFAVANSAMFSAAPILNLARPRRLV